MKIITKRKNGSIRVQTINNDPSSADPSFAKDCDVNEIMAKFARTGEINHLSKTSGQYIDASEFGDFQEAANTVSRANSEFNALPALIRERFNQNPSELISFLQDPSNIEEAAKLGLIPVPIPTASGTPETDASESALSKKTLPKSKTPISTPEAKPNE